MHYLCVFSDADAQQKIDEEERKRQAESADFPNKRRNMMVGGMVALTAMVGYAFLSGLVQVEITDIDDKNANSSNQELKNKGPDPANMNQFDHLFQQQEEANGNQKEQAQE